MMLVRSTRGQIGHSFSVLGASQLESNIHVYYVSVFSIISGLLNSPLMVQDSFPPHASNVLLYSVYICAFPKVLPSFCTTNQFVRFPRVFKHNYPRRKKKNNK